MSHLQLLSVTYRSTYWTGNTPLVELNHLPPPYRQNSQRNGGWPFFIASDRVKVVALKMSLIMFYVPLDFPTKNTPSVQSERKILNIDVGERR